jgi:hypothetical protein
LARRAPARPDCPIFAAQPPPAMIKYTPHYLNKLEGILKANNFAIRNEKGNFKSGVCLLRDERVLMVNKFATVETRINALLDILKELNGRETLNEEAQEVLRTAGDPGAGKSAS